MVHNPKELLPEYCSGMPVVSSPKFKGLPHYTPLVYRLHHGFVVPTASHVGASPEPPLLHKPSVISPPQEVFSGTSLFRLEMWSINALLLLDANMDKLGCT